MGDCALAVSLLHNGKKSNYPLPERGSNTRSQLFERSNKSSWK